MTTLRLANAITNPSVCLSSVTCVHPTQGQGPSGGLTFRGYFCTIL